MAGALAGAGGAVAVEQIRRLYLAASTRALNMLRRAMTRVLRSPDDQLEQFAARQRMGREAVALAGQTATEARTAALGVLDRAHHAGVTAAEHDLGLPAGEPDPAARQIAERLAGEITVEHQRIPFVLDNAYRRVVTDVLAAEPTRVNRRRAAQRGLDEFADRGIRVFRDRAGREWDIASYAEMAVRTVAARAQIDAYVARADSAGETLLQVSSSVSCCPLCLPYDGKIVAIRDLADAREAGLFHPNCRHRVSLVRPGPPIVRPAPDPALYAAQQRLRYLERRVRAARRREAVALDPQALRKARAELRAGWAAIRDHTQQAGIVRQRSREQVTRARG